MAGKITDLADVGGLDGDELIEVTDDPAGTAASGSTTVDAIRFGLSLDTHDHDADYEATGAVAAHTGDTTAAHAATAISFAPNGTIAATDVQAAIQEVRDEAGSPATLIVPGAVAPTPTTEGQVQWDTTNSYIVVGTGGGTAYFFQVAGTPSTQAFGDAASTGSASSTARSDHKHAMPANPMTSRSGCEVSRTGQSFANNIGAPDPVSFTDADTTDTDSYHNPASNASRVVAPFTGWYSVSASVDHKGDSSSAGVRQMWLAKNEAGAFADSTEVALASQSAWLDAQSMLGSGRLSVSWVGKLTAGDYVEVFYRQNSGSARSVNAYLSMIYQGS